MIIVKLIVKLTVIVIEIEKDPLVIVRVPQNPKPQNLNLKP